MVGRRWRAAAGGAAFFFGEAFGFLAAAVLGFFGDFDFVAFATSGFLGLTAFLVLAVAGFFCRRSFRFFWTLRFRGSGFCGFSETAVGDAAVAVGALHSSNLLQKHTNQIHVAKKDNRKKNLTSFWFNFFFWFFGR